jgi:hypothetical protein
MAELTTPVVPPPMPDHAAIRFLREFLGVIRVARQAEGEGRYCGPITLD